MERRRTFSREFKLEADDVVCNLFDYIDKTLGLNWTSGANGAVISNGKSAGTPRFRYAQKAIALFPLAGRK